MPRLSILREETSSSAVECVLCLSPTADMPSIFMCVLWMELRASLLARQLLYQMNHTPPLSVLFIFFVWVWFVSLFIYYYCVYVVFRGSAWTCHSAHVEVKGQFHGVSSLLYLFIGFKD